MKLFRREVYYYSVVSDKGKMFSEELLHNSNLFSADDLETVKIGLNGNVITWNSPIFLDFNEDDLQELFGQIQVDREYSNE